MLAPEVTAAEKQITDTFNSNAANTSSVHALENTVLHDLSPQPDWYSTINGALQTSQQKSMSWLLATSPSIFSTATQSYIDYANDFNVTLTPLSDLVREIARGGNIATAQQQEMLATFVQFLLNRAQENLTACSFLQEEVAAFRTQMAASQSTASTAVAAALANEGEIAAQIRATQSSINALMQKLAADTGRATRTTINSDTATFSMTISLTFGLALAGGVLSAGTMAVGVIKIGSAITKVIIHTDDVKQDIAEISKLLDELGQEQIQLALVQSVVTSLETLLKANDAALQTFIDLTTNWKKVVDDLQWLLVVLAQPQIDVSRIPALNDLAAANTAWQSISTFATKAQALQLSHPPVVELPPATISQTQAA